MKKLLSAILITAIIGGILMTGCSNTGKTVNAALGAPCFTGSGCVYEGSLSAITDGNEKTSAVIRPDPNYASELTFGDWYGNSHTEALPAGRIAVTVDLGFITAAEKITVTGEYSGAVKVYLSDDGYNFTKYLGEFGEKTIPVNSDVKAVMLTFESGEITLSEIAVTGIRTAERVLLSSGCSYEWEGTRMTAYSDAGTELTDGIYFEKNDDENTDALSGRTSHEEDALTGKYGNVITVDLGSIKNVSEVSFGAYLARGGKSIIPDRIDVRYSADGEAWTDFGQSFLISRSGASEDCSNRYFVTRAYTVEARYIKIFTYADGLFCTDEIGIYGCKTAVAEPEYSRPAAVESLTDAAAGCEALINGTPASALTDLIFTSGVPAGGSSTVKINLGKTTGITGVCVVCDGEITGISSAAEGKALYTEAAGKYTAYLLFGEAVTADEIEISFNCSGNVLEAEAFSGAAQLPAVSGGFFQLPTNGGGNAAAQNSEYSWFLQLKGMHDLGMSVVVIQYSTNFIAKTTLINGKHLADAGYTYTATYGCEDVCKAVLDAAAKLGMKVYIGTIHDADFTDPAANTNQYKAIVEDSKASINDIYELYSSHPAFGGYYLSDETCDYWLNLDGGVEACRSVYEGQSEYIRSVDGDASIMIAPAIWRSGDPASGADNLYEMLKPSEEGGKPVVDIVAVQDCLGRELSLTVSDEAYSAWLGRCELWAKAIRKAGAEFWHDAEVFEITSTSKRFPEIKKSLALQAPISGGIIVFDIPHYFSPCPMTGVNDPYGDYKRRIMTEYIEYYSSLTE